MNRVQQLLALYRRRIVQVVEEHGHDALPRRTREAVTVVTTATGALTAHVDPDIAVDPTPAPLASPLAQRYQAPTWHLLTQRLALDLSTTALDVTACNRNRPGLQSACFWDRITCIYRPGQDHLICI